MIELLLQAERAMSVGLVDRAEVLYAQVAEADPQNSIAVVGLARVALERGDETGALDLARRALTIDPENAAAARMTARLEEVLAFRVDQGRPTGVDAPRSGPAPGPAPASAAEPPPAIVTPAIVPPMVEPAPAPDEPPLAPSAPKARSLLDRLLRRHR